MPRAIPLYRLQMAKRGVRSVRALYQLLAPYDVRGEDGQGRRRGPGKDGLRLSLAQLHALVNGEAKQINVRALCAICAVLKCNINDLYDVTTETKDVP